MATAEQLFSEQGVDGVSLRAINSAADVGPAGVHYHFGSKEGLVEAVVRERATVVLDRVRAYLERLARRARPASAHELVEVIAGPYRELLVAQPVGGLRWIKLVAQLALADAELISRVAAEIEPRLLEQVTRSFPGVDPRVLRMRWALAVQTLIQMLSLLDHWQDADPHRYVDELVAFVCAGLDAVRADTLRARVHVVP